MAQNIRGGVKHLLKFTEVAIRSADLFMFTEIAKVFESVICFDRPDYKSVAMICFSFFHFFFFLIIFPSNFLLFFQPFSLNRTRKTNNNNKVRNQITSNVMILFVGRTLIVVCPILLAFLTLHDAFTNLSSPRVIVLEIIMMIVQMNLLFNSPTCSAPAMLCEKKIVTEFRFDC